MEGAKGQNISLHFCPFYLKRGKKEKKKLNDSRYLKRQNYPAIVHNFAFLYVYE